MKLIKFCGFTVHSKPNNMTLSTFPEKIPDTEKTLTELTNLIQFRYLGPPCKYLHSHFFFLILDLLLKLNVIHIEEN